MNRSELVKRLINEGLSSQTLMNLSDKQLIILSKRMLGEQQVGVERTTIPVNKINTSTFDGKKAVQDLITNPEKIKKGESYKITEKEKGKGEKKDKVCTKCKKSTCECKLTKEELKGKQKNLDKNNNGKLDKEDFKLLRSKKSEVKERKEPHDSDDDKSDVFPSGSSDWNKKKKKSEVKEGKSSPFAKEVKEGGKKWIQKAIDPSKKGSLKKALGVKKDETIPTGKLKSAAKKGGKLGQRARLAMTLKKLKESVETEDWVESLVENRYHSMATKFEIMELINKKLNESEVLSEIPEFMSYDSISDSSTETETKPITKPVTKPGTKPATPFNPGPKQNPGPSATETKPITKPVTKPTTKPNNPVWNPGPKVNPGPSAKVLDKNKDGKLDR